MKRMNTFIKRKPRKRSPPPPKKSSSESSTGSDVSPKREDCVLYESCALSKRKEAREKSGNKLLCPYHFKLYQKNKAEKRAQAMNEHIEDLRARWAAEDEEKAKGSRSQFVSEKVVENSTNEGTTSQPPAKQGSFDVMDSEATIQEMREHLEKVKARWAAEDEVKVQSSTGTTSARIHRHETQCSDTEEDDSSKVVCPSSPQGRFDVPEPELMRTIPYIDEDSP